MRPVIYLAGPINSGNFDAVRARNRRVAAWLEACGFDAIDPLDFKDVDELVGCDGDLDAAAIARGLVTGEQIVRNCLRQIDRSHALLFQLDELDTLDNHVWGTPCEMAYARFVRDLPCVAVMGATTFDSAWLATLSTQVKTYEEAEQALWQALAPATSRSA